MKRFYRVIYKIDVTANTHYDAAVDVWSLMNDPMSLPPLLDVCEWPAGAPFEDGKNLPWETIDILVDPGNEV